MLGTMLKCPPGRVGLGSAWSRVDTDTPKYSYSWVKVYLSCIAKLPSFPKQGSFEKLGKLLPNVMKRFLCASQARTMNADLQYWLISKQPGSRILLYANTKRQHQLLYGKHHYNA